MQTKTVDVHEAQTHLVELLSLVSAGTEIILTAGSTPLARIVPMGGASTPRVAGLHPGAIWTSVEGLGTRHAPVLAGCRSRTKRCSRLPEASAARPAAEPER